MITTVDEWEGAFSELSDRLIENLYPQEFLSLELVGEKSQFMRFNTAKVRQSGKVIDSSVKLKLIDNQRTAYASFPLTGNVAVDLAVVVLVVLVLVVVLLEVGVVVVALKQTVALHWNHWGCTPEDVLVPQPCGQRHAR